MSCTFCPRYSLEINSLRSQIIKLNALNNLNTTRVAEIHKLQSKNAEMEINALKEKIELLERIVKLSTSQHSSQAHSSSHPYQPSGQLSNQSSINNIGYNQEDSLLINKAGIDCGPFTENVLFNQTTNNQTTNDELQTM